MELALFLTFTNVFVNYLRIEIRFQLCFTKITLEVNMGYEREYNSIYLISQQVTILGQGVIINYTFVDYCFNDI